MKKIFYLLLLVLVSLLFTSCIDYVQSISYEDGKYQLYYKVTLSKVLFAMGGENPEDMLESFDDSMDDLPDNVKYQAVNTDLELGMEFSLAIDPRTGNGEEKEFLPTVSGKNCFIPFFLGEEEESFADSFSTDDEETRMMAEAFLSSAKCRVLISKKIVPSVQAAYFPGRGGQNYSVPVFDYGDSYCAEIPFSVLFESGMYRFDTLVVVMD